MAAEPRQTSGLLRAAGAPRERRSALWPYLVMPLIVVLVFCALRRVHLEPRQEPATTPAASGAPAEPAQQ
jgi:hypothetical protein